MGIHHLGLATKDMDKTAAFYEGVLGFKKVVDDIVQIDEGGRVHHIMFDMGDGQLIAFMEAQELDWVPDFDPSINGGLGTPHYFYHIAFDAGSDAGLMARREALVKNGVSVSPVIDNHGSGKSIYFRDPNGLLLEFAYLTHAFVPEDAEPMVRVRMSAKTFMADPSIPGTPLVDA